MTADIDATLAQVINLKRQIKSMEGMLDTALQALAEAVDTGLLDPQFSHDDTSFALSPGRVTYTYPDTVTAISLRLKDAQSAAIADGTATMKRGAPYWTVKLPKAS